VSPSHRAATLRILVALALGFAAGVAIAASDSAALHAVAHAVEPVGTLWVNAIRMTIVPLVPSLLIVGVASSGDVQRIGRLGGRAIPLFVALLLAGGCLALLIARPALAGLHIDPAVAASLRTAAAPATLYTVAQLPGLGQWIAELIPVNPLKSAVDGAMLPLIVFSLALGTAATRIAPDLRAHLVGWFQAISEAMLVIVGWVLVAAPVGVFALMLGLGLHMGIGAVGAVAYYVAVVSGVLVLFTIAMYPVATIGGGIRLRAFAIAAAPAQAVAISTRSSFAALPAMITAARDRLRFPPEITGFALPFAVSVFRANVPVAWVVGAIFLGRLYGVPLHLAGLITLLLTSVAMSFTVPGIPSGGLYVLAPVITGMGIPAEGVGILIAIDTIPDMFKTIVSVTGHMTAASVLARHSPPEEPSA
jgi:proton glutamate symport protein